MKLSTRTRYGMRAMLDLALHYGAGLVLLKDIARRQQISERYLEQLILPLKAASLVTSMRGAHGGCALARQPSLIRLTEIVEALEGPLTLAECVNDPISCPQANICVARDIWAAMSKAMSGVLESTTLQDLVQRQREKEDPAATMYYI